MTVMLKVIIDILVGLVICGLSILLFTRNFKSPLSPIFQIFGSVFLLILGLGCIAMGIFATVSLGVG